MWVYEQSELETMLPTETQERSDAPSGKEGVPENIETIPAAPEPVLPQASTAPIPEPTPKETPRRKRSTPGATRDCWLLAAAFLLGSTAAGFLQAVCDARQAELLRYYLDAWRGLFSVPDLQHMVRLFGTEYFTLGIMTSLFMLLGLSALGPLLIFACMMLYGLGSGLLLVQMAAAQAWQTAVLSVLWTGIPAAAACGCLCLFAASALQVSGRIRAYSFWNRTAGQARPGVRALLGQYLLLMVVLLPLCGAAAGLSYLGTRFC